MNEQLQTTNNQQAERTHSPEEVFQDILEKRRLHDREEFPTVEGIKDLLKDLPSIVANNLLKDAEYLRERAVDERAFRELFLRETKRVWSQYTVERFGMPSKIFAKEEVKHAIDVLLSNHPSLDGFKNVARISVDLNGLKAVNDLNRGDHTKGDMFLEIVARTIKDEQMVNNFKMRGITLISTSDGGDEFGIVVIAETPIDAETLNEIKERINTNLLSEKTTNELKKVLDFNDEIVTSSFAGFNQEEWDAKSNDEKTAEIQKIAIPEDFTFQAHVSMGAATLYDSFWARTGQKNEIQDGDSYERILDKLMGAVFTQSDTMMQEEKDSFKKRLQESEKPQEKFLSLVYSRNESERGLARELYETKNELDTCLKSK